MEVTMEPFIGQIMLFPYGFEPRGWALCDGKMLGVRDYSSLFSLLGKKFGGDGRTTFGLPKMSGPANNVAYYIALQGIYPSRN
jgi:microcystin-dependent protein